MALSRHDLEIFVAAEELWIQTQDEGGAHRTVVWVVEGGGHLYVRSFRGDAGAWFRRALANPRVALISGDTAVEFDAIPATDPESIELASDGFRQKYANDPYLGAMVHPRVLGTTLRLEPV